jgi:hypothetical protein
MTYNSSEFETFDAAQILEAVGGHVDLTTNRVVGIYGEVSGGPQIGFGGEGIYFRGVDTQTGQIVQAYYLGATIGVDASLGTVGAGLFGFTGPPESLGGWSAGGQVSAIVSSSISVSTDGSVLYFFGSNTSLGVNASTGYTAYVSVDGQHIYNFGSINRTDYSLDEYNQAMTQLINGDISQVTVRSPNFDVSLAGGPENGTLVEEYHRYGDNVYVTRYVIDENGERIQSTEVVNLLRDMWEGAGWVQASPVSGAIMTIHDLNDIGVRAPECFPAHTPILLADHSQKPISEITPQDTVLAPNGLGELVPCRVVRTFTNITDHFYELAFSDNREPLQVTGGHRFLAKAGDYLKIEDMLALGGGSTEVVLADGSLHTVQGARIAYSAETAHLFEEVQIAKSTGNLAAKPENGWKTYDFCTTQ